MTAATLHVVLQSANPNGVCYQRPVTVDPEHGRPDLRPEKPWDRIGEADRVTGSDGAEYVVDRVTRLPR